MKIKGSVVVIQLIMAMLLVLFFHGSGRAGKWRSHLLNLANWRFPVAVSWISGYNDLVDFHQDNLEAERSIAEAESCLITETESCLIPLSFHPYIQLNKNWGVGGGIGPFTLILGDTGFFNLPIRLDLRYARTIPWKKIPVYLRAGPAYHLARGAYVEKSNPGISAGLGAELLKNKKLGKGDKGLKISLGLEIGYDMSEIKFEKITSSSSGDSATEKIKPGGLMFSIFALF